jgi:nucleotide-binding universal stress UspA family protein
LLSCSTKIRKRDLKIKREGDANLLFYSVAEKSRMSSNSSRALFPLKKILVSTDGSENAKRAVTAASTMAKQNGAELLIIHVVSEAVPAQYAPIGINAPVADYTTYFNTIEEQGKTLVSQTVEQAKREGVNARGQVLRTISSTVEAIVEASDNEHADLIVVGTRGLGGFRKLLLGSVSSGIVSHATCSVLIVR